MWSNFYISSDILCYLSCLVGSAIYIDYRFASLCVTRLLFSTTTLLTKFIVAPESTKASVCTFLPYTQSVTGILKKVVLLYTILLQDSSTTSDLCKLIEGILSSISQMVTYYLWWVLWYFK